MLMVLMWCLLSYGQNLFKEEVMDTEQTDKHEEEVQLELFEKPKPVIKVLDEDDGEY